MDTFFYLISEGFRSLWRTKVNAVISIIVIGVTMSFVGFGGVIGQEFNRLIETARSKYELEVFFSPLLTDGEANLKIQEISQLPFVLSAKLITKQEAAEIFEEEFGENIFDLLLENPLPSSCVVKIKSAGSEKLDIYPMIEQIKSIEHVEEVRSNGRLISIIENYYQGFNFIITGVGVVVLLGTIILVSNTIRLTIHSRQNLIRILKLVGATNGFIRTPFLIEGMVEGVAGSLVACAITFGYVRGTNSILSLFTTYQMQLQFDLLLFFTFIVVIFSLFGSLRAVKKYLA